MRIYAIWGVVLFMCAYSWKDWFKGLCFLVLMMAVVERPDMPKEMLGIPGFNPWNLLFLNVVSAAFLSIRSDPSSIAMPKNIKRLLIFYLFVIVLAFYREISDSHGLRQMLLFMGDRGRISVKELFIEDILNTIKYAVPGILLFYGCNSKKHFKLACGAILLMNFVLALLVIKVMPFAALTDGEILQRVSMSKLDKNVGYYRSDLAILLGGAAWALFAYRHALQGALVRNLLVVACGLTSLAVGLTGGRMGMGVWIVVGMIMAFYKYRKFMIFGPIFVLIVVATIPSVQDRFTQGFSGDEEQAMHAHPGAGENVDMTSVTSGRTVIWPYVIDRISSAPFFGYGRRAMQRIGLSSWLVQELRELFPHPHNAYLQFLLDNGFVLSIPVFLFYLILAKYSMTLFKDKEDMIAITAGAMGVSFIIAFLFGGVAQQSFYPVISSVGMWFSIGLVLRMYTEKYMTGDAVKCLDDCSDESWSPKKA